MKIANIHLNNLRGEEHFQFGRDVIALVEATGVEDKVSAQVAAFAAVNQQEDEAVEQIRRSALTAQIAAADRARDDIFYGLSGTIRSSGRHFSNAVRKASERLSLPMKTYGPVATRNYAAQSAKTYKLIQELHTNYSADVAALALEPWLDELERLNNIVVDLLRQRNDEKTNRTSLVMREVRTRADKAYRSLVRAVEALYEVASMGLGGDGVGPAAPYKEFIERLNAMIEHYSNTIAVRKGRAAAKKED